MTDSTDTLYSWHDEIMPEPFDTILECLGSEGAKLFSVEITPKGLQIVELCDGYYGTTLTKKQLNRLIEELSALSQKLGGQPEKA